MKKKLFMNMTCMAIGIGFFSGLCGGSTVIAASANECRVASVSANVAEEDDGNDGSRQEIEKHYYINEIYRYVYTEEDIHAYFEERNRQKENIRPCGTGEIPYFDNYDAVFEYVRDKMIARSEEFAFTVPQSIRLMQVGEEIWPIHNVAVMRSMDESYSVSCKDGDYLRANYIGTEWIDAASYDDVNGTVTYTIRNIYTSTAAEEAQVDAAIPGVLSSLGLEGKSEYEKIKAIHDYIVEHVEYDYDALDSYYETGKTDPSVHSTYAALIKGKSVCQGYASLFNRLCEEAGISCRYTGGYSFGVPHAWNVVKLGDLWYNVDVTGDDLETSISYEKFLRSEEAFSDRIGGLTEEEKATHPMSQTDYPMPEDKPDNPEPGNVFHPFTDVPAEGWKAEAVSYVYRHGIMNGISGTTLFEPDSTLTRGMFATILYRMAGSPSVVYDSRFSDVPAGKWYSDAVIWAAEEGIVQGFGDGSYGVNVDITREQVIKMIALYAQKMGNDISSSNSLETFEDMDSVSCWAKEYAGWAVDNGIISGRPTDGGGYRIDPRGTATRAECAKMVSNYHKAYN